MTLDSLPCAHSHLAKCAISRCAWGGTTLVSKNLDSRGRQFGWKTSTIHAMPVTKKDKMIKSDATRHRNPNHFVQNGIVCFFSRKLLECVPVFVRVFASALMHINCVSFV